MRQNGPGAGWFIALALLGSAAAVGLAAWLGNWGGWNPKYDTLTHDGARVTEVGASLATAEERWAQTHDSWIESGDAIAASGDADSRCYLQVWSSGELADVGLCGPFVRAEGGDPEWAPFDWDYEALVDDTVRIHPQEMRPRMASEFFVEPSTHDEIGDSGQALFYEDSDLVGADDRLTDRARAATPPLGWPRTVEATGAEGDLMSMFGSEVVASEVLRLYGHDYLVEVGSVGQLKFRGDHTYVPAPGGGILVFRIAPAKPNDTAAKKALARAVGLSSALKSPNRNAQIRITFEAKSGGERFASTYAEFMTEWRGAPASGGGSELIPPSAMLQIPELEGATYAVVVNGRRHPVS